MNRTISVKCPQCSYTRYDLLHISGECGGLLLKDEHNNVTCKLCGGDMGFDVCVTCSACGYERVIDLVNIESVYKYEIVKMEIFESVVVVF